MTTATKQRTGNGAPATKSGGATGSKELRSWRSNFSKKLASCGRLHEQLNKALDAKTVNPQRINHLWEQFTALRNDLNAMTAPPMPQPAASGSG